LHGAAALSGWIKHTQSKPNHLPSIGKSLPFFGTPGDPDPNLNLNPNLNLVKLFFQHADS
jgi:hypothetical protein